MELLSPLKINLLSWLHPTVSPVLDMLTHVGMHWQQSKTEGQKTLQTQESERKPSWFFSCMPTAVLVKAPWNICIIWAGFHLLLCSLDHEIPSFWLPVSVAMCWVGLGSFSQVIWLWMAATEETKVYHLMMWNKYHMWTPKVLEVVPACGGAQKQGPAGRKSGDTGKGRLDSPRVRTWTLRDWHFSTSGRISPSSCDLLTIQVIILCFLLFKLMFLEYSEKVPGKRCLFLKHVRCGKGQLGKEPGWGYGGKAVLCDTSSWGLAGRGCWPRYKWHRFLAWSQRGIYRTLAIYQIVIVWHTPVTL